MSLSKNSRRVLIIGGVALLFLIAYLVAGLLIGKEPQPALDITGPDEKGTLHSLSDHFGKHPTVLLFFDTKTDKATELLEQVAALEKDYDAKVMAVAVNGDYEEQKSALEKMGARPSLLLFDVEGEMAKTYNVSTTPVTYFIDKSGMVQNVFLSSITDKTLKKTLASLD